MKRLLNTLALLLIAVFSLSAQNSSPQSGINPVINDILNSYKPWKSVEFEGKIKNDRLPVTPTIKMYMVNGSLIQISIRAIFVGEVARIDITPSEILIVNKLKKTYCQESPENLLELYPGLINDLQSLFLARITVLGQGELSLDNYSVMTVSSAGNDEWLVIPDQEEQGKLKYGYLVGSNSRTKALIAEIGDLVSCQIDYSYPGKGMQMNTIIESRNKSETIVFDFNSVKWGGSKMADPKLDNYKRLDPKDFVRSF